jgi:hypothetical protein
MKKPWQRTLSDKGGSAAPSGDAKVMRLRRPIFNIEQGTARSTFAHESAPNGQDRIDNEKMDEVTK